jgi:hypothetical protein
MDHNNKWQPATGQKKKAGQKEESATKGHFTTGDSSPNYM